MSRSPVLQGDWVGPGTHVDLIGAFTPEMREADDALLRKAEIFVDSRETTLHDIGELKIPLEAGVIAESDVRGDLYDLCGGAPGRSGGGAVTLYKNGGGAHLDLMTTTLIYEAFREGLSPHPLFFGSAEAQSSSDSSRLRLRSAVARVSAPSGEAARVR